MLSTLRETGLEAVKELPSHFLDGLLRGSLCQHRHGLADDS